MRRKIFIPKKITAIVLVMVLIMCFLFGSIVFSDKPETSKYTAEWFESHDLFPDDNVMYYVIDNPSWFKDNGLENVFAISFQKHGNDYHIGYDIGGIKIGIYSLSGEYYGYNQVPDKETVYISISDTDSIPNDSFFVKDKELLTKMLSTDLTKGKIKYEGINKEDDIVTVSGKDYKMTLYINTQNEECERFELVDKSSSKEESFKCYISNCNRISMPDDYDDSKLSSEMTIGEYSNEVNAFITGAMYMLAMQQPIDTTESEE